MHQHKAGTQVVVTILAAAANPVGCKDENIHRVGGQVGDVALLVGAVPLGVVGAGDAASTMRKDARASDLWTAGERRRPRWWRAWRQ